MFNPHHYNILAKEIRELWELEKPTDSDYVKTYVKGNQTTLSVLVAELIKRFADDNPAFDSNRFMQAAIPRDVRDQLIDRALSG